MVVAHGSPSAPQAPEAALRRLADRVAGHLPGWVVQGATLAGPGALDAALMAVPDRRPMIYPLFMSDGWFVREALPQRLRDALGGSFEVLQPLGLDPALQRLCLDQVKRGAATAGLAPGEATVVIAAHGSRSDPRPRRAAELAAQVIARAGLFRAVRIGFIDQAPDLAEVARLDGPALCLPFFAGRAGHVEKDLPAALAAASFTGPLLDPIGAAPEIPEIVAAALSAQARRQAA